MKIKFLELSNNSIPFEEWANTLLIKSRVKILDYIKRVSEGGSKKIKSLGDNIFEIKINYELGFILEL